MQLKDIMSRDLEVICPDATVHEASRRMRACNIGSVIVGDGNDFQGILPDRDITVRVAADGHNPTTTTVHEVMTPEILWCFDDADLSTAANFMKEKPIRHLAVPDRNRQLVGIVSLCALAIHSRDENVGRHSRSLAGSAAKFGF